MPNQYVLVDREDRIVTLTMHDPPTLNAWNTTMGEELLSELIQIEGSADDRVVILTGSGQRGFNSGANMRQMVLRGSLAREGGRNPYQWHHPSLTLIQQIAWKLHSMKQLTIAAVNGAAAGGGMGLAAGCDIRIASENARFTSVFVRRGLVPDEGSLYFLPRILGLGRALELVLTGKLIDAHEAERLGFVSKVVPAGQVLPEAKRLAADVIANCPPISLGLIKAIMTESLAKSFAETARLCDLGFNISTSTEDHREAVRAYGEKRTPHFHEQ